MRAIYKYPIPFGGEATVQIPASAELLKFGVQGINANGTSNLCVWAIVDTTDTETQALKIRIHGTGQPLPDNTVFYLGNGDLEYQYYDTIFDREFVWHIFVGTDNT